MANQHITHIAIAVVLDGDRVLIGQRPEGVALAGCCEFPGGKIEAGETPSDAACRECFEEAGIRVAAQETLHETQHTYDHGTVQLHFIACQASDLKTSLTPPFRWVHRRDLSKYDFPAANSRVVRMLLDSNWKTG